MATCSIKRRDFITLVGGTAVAWPLAAHAQQPAKIPSLEILLYDNPRVDRQIQAFRHGLRDFGYIRLAYGVKGGPSVLIDPTMMEEVRG